jgi:diadenosine tetraphosphate (Ap4A) HIT family hydrolase
VTADLDAALTRCFQPDKLNYLMLMMVDPDVHFHVLPRYEDTREFSGRTHRDRFWPKPVDLTQPVEADPALAGAVRDALRGAWRKD